MTDNEIIKGLEHCTYAWCVDCPLYSEKMYSQCETELTKAALDLIKRQQKKIDELMDQEARFAFDRIHRNVAELNLIQEDYNVAELKKRFRAEFEEKMELGLEDCINWADWLDSIASEMWEEVKGATDDR